MRSSFTLLSGSDALAVVRARHVCAQEDHGITDAQLVARSRTGWNRRRAGAVRWRGSPVRTAEQGADAQQQLAQDERFRQVVVGAQLEAADAVGVGERADRTRTGVGHRDAASRAGRRSRPFGQHHVEHDEVDAAALDPFECRSAVANELGVETFGDEVVADHLAERTLVLDDEAEARHAARTSVRRRATRRRSVRRARFRR
jgi:hypothetical protein